MEVIKKTDDYTIYQKRSKRYAVEQNKAWVNGEEKAKILLAEGLIKLTEPKAPEPEAPQSEAPEPEAAPEAASTEAAAEGEADAPETDPKT